VIPLRLTNRSILISFDIKRSIWKFVSLCGTWGVLTVVNQLCVGGCGNLEDAYHLFLHCGYFRQTWNAIYNWFGFIMVNLSHISYHLIQFVAFGGFPKKVMCGSSFDLVLNGLSHLARNKCSYFSAKGGCSSSPTWQNYITIFLVVEDESC